MYDSVESASTVSARRKCYSSVDSRHTLHIVIRISCGTGDSPPPRGLLPGAEGWGEGGQLRQSRRPAPGDVAETWRSRRGCGPGFGGLPEAQGLSPWLLHTPLTAPFPLLTLERSCMAHAKGDGEEEGKQPPLQVWMPPGLKAPEPEPKGKEDGGSQQPQGPGRKGRRGCCRG